MTTLSMAQASAPVSSPWPSKLSRLMYACALAGGALYLYSMRRADPDLWGYLASGRLFLEQGALTTTDPFAYTSGGSEWVIFEYLAHIVLWLSYQYGGPAGLIALKCVLGGVALYCLFAAIRAMTDNPHVSVPVFLLCASAVSRFFLFRPQLFTFAFFALFVAVLVRFLLRQRAPLWVLPIAMLVWANTHGGFVAGLGALGLAILLRASENLSAGRWQPRQILTGTRALWATLGVCLATTFVNPMGVRLWSYVLTEITHDTNRRYTVEWGPASLRTDAWSAIALTIIAVVLAAVTWFARSAARRETGPSPLFWAMTCVPVIVMAYVSVRHVPIAAIWAGPVMALLASRSTDGAPFRRFWLVARGVALLPVCLTFAVVYAEPRPEIRADGTVLGRTHPCRAVAFLRDNRLTGNIYNPLWWGSYITWELYPSIRVSMDGRNISLYPDAMVIENFDFYLKDAPAADIDAPLRYDTDFLLVPANSPVLSRVRFDARWQQAYADADASLFVRADAAHRSLVAAINGATRTLPGQHCAEVMK